MLQNLHIEDSFPGAGQAKRRLVTRMHGARHKAFVRMFSGAAPYYLVNEYPKSGGSWLGEMLSDALGLPFARNRPISLQRCVTQGHFLSPLGLRRPVVLWRDPRDVMVSFYHHCYFVNEFSNAQLVALMQHHLPFRDRRDVRANLPEFIRFVCSRPVAPGFTWAEFAEVWANRPGTVQVRYEDLRRNAPATLARVVAELTGDELPRPALEAVTERHSFERAKAKARERRRPGVEVSFVREGSVGGWRQHFSPEAEWVMNTYCAPGMERLGYATAPARDTAA